MSRRWPRPKGIKHVAAHPSGWNVTLNLQLKKVLFSTNQYHSPPKFFGHKRDYKTVNKSSKESVGSETSREKIVTRRIRSRTKNSDALPIKLAFQLYTRPTHVTHRAIITKQPLNKDFHPLSSWPVIWWKSPYLFFIYLKINEIKSIPLVRCLLQLHAYFKQQKESCFCGSLRFLDHFSSRGGCNLFLSLRVSDYRFHLNCYCYSHNVSADMSSDLLQVFVELRNLHGTSDYVLYWIHGARLFWSR